MNTQSYYTTADGFSNIKNTDDHLRVNCTGLNVFDKAFWGGNHVGRNDEYLMYLHQGSLKIKIDGIKQTMSEGDVVVYPSNKSYYYTSEGCTDVIYFWVHFTGNASESILSDLSIETGKVVAIGKNEHIPSQFNNLFRCLYGKELFYEIEASAYLTEILIDVGRRVNLNEGNVNLKGKISRSLDYIYKNYNNDIKIEELARIEHLSVSRYSALFTDIMGEPPHKFIISLRIDNAVSLLLRSNLNVKQIALSVGYADSLYFSKLFKSRMKMSPKEYRSRLLNRA